MTFIESETIELKSSVVADLCKEVIAFANTRGGTLYIGVEDNGTVIGVDSADRVTLQINNMVRDSIKPDITMFVHYETQVIDDKQIIAVTVQEGGNHSQSLHLSSIIGNLPLGKLCFSCLK